MMQSLRYVYNRWRVKCSSIDPTASPLLHAIARQIQLRMTPSASVVLPQLRIVMSLTSENVSTILNLPKHTQAIGWLVIFFQSYREVLFAFSLVHVPITNSVAMTVVKSAQNSNAHRSARFVSA